jgi:hypothetical protein
MRSDLSGDDAETLTQELGDFANHYTMQAERDVHESHMRAQVGELPAVEMAEQSNHCPSQDEELGENVEFF